MLQQTLNPNRWRDIRKAILCSGVFLPHWVNCFRERIAFGKPWLEFSIFGFLSLGFCGELYGRYNEVCEILEVLLTLKERVSFVFVVF